MNKHFTDYAWKDYLYRQPQDRKTERRINLLIEDACGNGYKGIGKPEPLAGDLSGWWSRHINESDRPICRIEGGEIVILACGYHCDAIS